MNKIENYQLLKEGDLVRLVGSEVGIVTEIQKWGQVQVFWPMTNKISTHGKEWAELHFELMLDEKT
ncbi:MAG: hypothetical protein CMB52_05560 [Euryarchaeota archaeon]|nr:hypothetical protein [Euryarchaeota archaeon]MBJ84964.1 hypothetical protein [Euryarchaeota archaeon]|tara:strand:- start:866 stop:1063 length:198 start_codon:yes stop_codon:yes gene_type:complete